MKIINLRREKGLHGRRVAATVQWEDSQRPSMELYYETEGLFADDLICNPHAFLIACCMPALYHGEERIFIDAAVSPEVKEGLGAAMRWIRHWRYGERRRLAIIEAAGEALPATHGPRRAGMFFSGGIDSLGALRENRFVYPPEHPWSIRDGLLVCGLETEDLEKFDHVKESISGLGKTAGITLIPVYTNVRQLDTDWMFWEHAFHDAVFAAIAHAFSRRLNIVSIASTYDIPNIKPYGTHPLLDTCYSSHEVLIRHDGLCLTRLEKTKLVADWDGVLAKVRVCNRSDHYEHSRLNCGICNKCVRTMLALETLGALDTATSFPASPLTREMVADAVDIYDTTVCFFEELIAPLKKRGRHDLAQVIEEKIAAYQERRERRCVRHVLSNTLRAKVKRFDRRYLNGRLKRMLTHGGEVSQS